MGAAMIRLKDVAEKAGVSVWTVSKVLNPGADTARISDECARGVRAAAETLGYRPNYHARSLQTGRAQALGLVLQGSEGSDVPRDQFWSFMLRGVETRARSLGYDVLIIGPKGTQNEIERGVEYVKEQRVDALVVPGYMSAVAYSDMLENYDVPAVLATSPRPSWRHTVVELDPAPGIAAAVEHLVALGHRKLLWLGPDDEGGRKRQAAFTRAAKAAGIATGLVVFKTTANGTDAVIAEAQRVFSAQLKEKFSATGVVCYNEAAALGVYAAAAEAGLKIPRDLSVIGFDDIHAAMALPPMTVASHMLEEIGARAAELAVELTQKRGKRRNPRVERIASKLVVRKSTAQVTGDR